MKSVAVNEWVYFEVSGTEALPQGSWSVSADDENWLFRRTAEQESETKLCFPRATCRLEKLEPEHVCLGEKGLLEQFEVPPVRMQFTLPQGEQASLTASCTPENIRKLSAWGIKFLPVYDLLDKPEKTEMLVCAQGAGLLPDGARLDVWREQDRLVLLKRDNGIYTGKRTIQCGAIAVKAIRSVRQIGEVKRVAHQFPGTPGGIQPGKAVLIGALLAIVLGFVGAVLLSGIGLIGGIAAGIIGGIYFSQEEGTPAHTEYEEIDERRVSMDLNRPDGGVASILFQKEAWEPLHRLLSSAELQGSAGSKDQEGEDLLAQLERLSALYEKGHLTPSEFEQAKARLLAQI